jgi:hypothetical protein
MNCKPHPSGVGWNRLKAPVTEVKKAFKGKITIFGGIPSVVLLEQSMSDREFDPFLKGLFGEITPGDRFILGAGDTTPPEPISRVFSGLRRWFNSRADCR